MNYEEKALGYHAANPPGKIGMHCTKPLASQEDLSVAYSPGVAGPCRVIAKDENASFLYTGRGNLVGVISNGTAVLGLGDIGPYAAKPVMEGKAMLFKKFADIDVFDLELKTDTSEAFIQAVAALEPTFGAINLEDIKAPECFYIEEKLKEIMSIPVFHDDQHGTAIIASSAFINALELTKRDIKKVKVVFSGAGAAAIGIARTFLKLGVLRENLVLCDSKGVVSSDRSDLNEYKKSFATQRNISTLEEALTDADAFVGVSAKGVLTKSMLQKMASNPIVFALANPDPEITPEEALSVRDDVIIATGRSDYPNQVNNVLGFPYIFRGALDVRAKTINQEMELAAIYAIAALAKEDVPEEVLTMYKDASRYVFGRDYLIPKPVDQRVLLRVAPAVAKAAMDSGVARIKIDLNEYTERIEKILGPTRRIIRKLRKETVSRLKNKQKPKIVLTAAHDIRVIKACRQIVDCAEVDLVLLGQKRLVKQSLAELGLKELPVAVIDPMTSEYKDIYAEELYKLRARRGVTLSRAHQLILNQNYFAAMMLKQGHVSGMVNGVDEPYSDSVTPILEVLLPGQRVLLSGVYMMVIESRLSFFSDCTINIDPTAEELAEIAIKTAETAKEYTKDPIRIAMLSFTSFGTSKHKSPRKVAEAVEIVQRLRPDLEIDGEMQVDVALNEELRRKEFPFCRLQGNANVFVFPDLTSANIGYKLLTYLGGAVPTGPILVGLGKPANVVQRSASIREIVDLIHLTAHQSVRV